MVADLSAPRTLHHSTRPTPWPQAPLPLTGMPSRGRSVIAIALQAQAPDWPKNHNLRLHVLNFYLPGQTPYYRSSLDHPVHRYQ
jgi:hypothetical protein